jgi:hypothetical protein
MGASALVLPRADAIAMQHHLDEISRCVAAGAHAVLALDKAGWHTTRKLQVPANISLLHLRRQGGRRQRSRRCPARCQSGAPDWLRSKNPACAGR